MEEDGGDLSPFWLQSSTNHRRRSSPFLLNSGVLIFLLCVTAVLSIFFIVPSILSFTSQIFRPNSVKKSWDSLNLVLVLFALVFGFFSRNKNYDTNFDEDQRVVSNTIRNEIQNSNRSTPHQWYEYSDRTVYGGGLRRVSSSYPDLREVVAADDRWQFSDDTQVETHRYSQSDQLRRRPSWKRIEEELEEGSDQTKTIHVDTLEAKEAPYTPPPQPSSPPPEQPVVQRKPKRTYESIAEKRNNEMENESEPTETQVLPAVPDPPSMHRKRSVDNFLTSLRKKKKKKQRQRSVDNFDTLLQPQTRPLSLLLPSPPPPPPPPPPPSVFQNLLSSKKGKNKKYLSVPPPPPPPPPFTVARASKTTSQISPVVASEPPMPVNLSSFNSGGESPLMGNKSPLIPIPPPPPPPPFKMPSWKFLVKGDYVRIGSMDSSRSGSPDLDDVDSPRSDISSECGVITSVDGGEVVAPTLFCPSPDVNTKADMFIAKFRAGLKLQKNNSIKQKGLGLSNLGPETKPGQ